VHGAGGGFDQVISGAGRLVAAGYQIIAPSRFGYLRSSNPNDPSPENQADAYAVLLDELHIESVAVIGVSAGALSALQFAVRQPDRCRSLTLIVPAASVAGNVLFAPNAMTKAIIEYTLKSDFIYWLGITLARDRVIRSLLATDPALVAAARPDERQRAHDMLWKVLPISERAQGL
jgi:pimeloyl-ACP methyl ester carboxylesterase